jgi:FkbM family methyltransferase
MSARLLQVVAHAWRIGNARPALFAMLDAAAIGPLRTFWAKEAPWHLGKFVERTGNTVRLDGCRLDVSSTTFSTFQRGCLWLSRHEEPERIAVARYLDPDLPVIELGASTGMLSCLINRRLRQPSAHVAVEANPDLISVVQSNRALNGGSFTVVHAAVAYDGRSIGFVRGEDHLAGQADAHVELRGTIETTTVRQLLDRFKFERATLVCDIEGMEIDMWRQEPDTLVQRIAWLIVELHEPISGVEAVHEFIDGLQTRGFTLVWERSWTRVFRNTRWEAA